MIAAERNKVILVDTGVWLDTFFPWRPDSDTSSGFVMQALDAGYELAYPVHVLKDVFYLAEVLLLQKFRDAHGEPTEENVRAARSVAWRCIDNMRSVATAVAADESDTWLACGYRDLHDDLGDNLVLAAAQRAEVLYLVTTNEALLRKATVEAHSPADALALVALARP